MRSKIHGESKCLKTLYLHKIQAMEEIHPQFITDAEGNRVSVILPIEEYRALLEELEMQEDIRMYDEVKASNEPSIPIDDAFKWIEANRAASK
jgi:hypothetical protein